MGGVEEVGDGAHLLLPDLPGVAGGVQGPHGDPREAVPEPGEGDGVLVLGDHEFAGGADLEDDVVDVGLGAQAVQLRLGLDGQVVDGDQLLVEVVEGRAGRFEPVLERGDVAHRRVQVVQVLHGAGCVRGVLVVLLGGEGARSGDLGGVGRAVDEVAPADDQVVPAGEKAVGGL